MELRWRLAMHRWGRRHGFPVAEGHAVRLHVDGNELLAAVREMAGAARSSLLAEMYIWADDAAGRGVAEAFGAAAARGVKVRVVVDAVGSFGREALFRDLRAAGVEVLSFHPLRPGPFRRLNRRNHRKVLIADGTVALVGSANWASEYDPGSRPDAFRDLGLSLRGPLVGDLVKEFRRVWSRAGGSPFAPDPEEAPELSGPWREGVPVQAVSSLGKAGPRAIRRHVSLLVRQAQRELWIASAYFVPERRLVRLLARAARRGVDVRVLVPGRTDLPFVQAAARAGYGPLLEAGVRIYERQERMLHSKAAVIDGLHVVLGSANLDSRSFRHNLELNLAVHDRALAEAIRAVLAGDMARSRAVTLDAWRARPLWVRAWHRLAYAFRWWL